METVWERRRLKRETFEPEDMHTARGGEISAHARLGSCTCQALPGPLSLGRSPPMLAGLDALGIPSSRPLPSTGCSPAFVPLPVPFCCLESFSSIHSIIKSSLTKSLLGGGRRGRHCAGCWAPKGELDPALLWRSSQPQRGGMHVKVQNDVVRAG